MIKKHFLLFGIIFAFSARAETKLTIDERLGQLNNQLENINKLSVRILNDFSIKKTWPYGVLGPICVLSFYKFTTIDAQNKSEQRKWAGLTVGSFAALCAYTYFS